MLNFASNCLAGSVSMNNSTKPTQVPSEYSDDEASSDSREEALECPICWESFNIVENVPYVLWCGHTLCKNCVLGLQWAVVKFPTLPIRLPLSISCPWCNLSSFRFVYRGNLKFPRKNYFLLWMVESKNGDRDKSPGTFCEDHQPILLVLGLFVVTMGFGGNKGPTKIVSLWMCNALVFIHFPDVASEQVKVLFVVDRFFTYHVGASNLVRFGLKRNCRT
ncbi:hypothetical protein H0E87_008532 [Populus deltoides]|uniref:RING-type domain-containing protein n=1 Tax=Populus deltoides TaxID=3696 RepID=A0A8T2Z0U3_POPDE|nr:hypothetical protein H0E87_008532 [Populus deltoides]